MQVPHDCASQGTWLSLKLEVYIDWEVYIPSDFDSIDGFVGTLVLLLAICAAYFLNLNLGKRTDDPTMDVINKQHRP